MKIDKSFIFNYLNSKKVIYKIEDEFLIIYEKNNENKAGKLYELKINIDIDGDFWLIECENFPKEIKPFENIYENPEAILLNFRENTLDIILIEMKSKKWNYESVKLKFQNGFIWFLSLLCLFNYQNQSIKIFGIIPNQNEKLSSSLEKMDFLNIFETKTMPITIKPFISNSEKIEININEIYKRI